MRMNVTQALAFIADHDHFATVTPDGLIARTNVVWAHERNPAFIVDASDCVFEEIEAFPVGSDGRVDGNAISAWLGY